MKERWKNSRWRACPSNTGRIDCVFENGKVFTWVVGVRFYDFMETVAEALGKSNSFELARLLLGNMDEINRMYYTTKETA